MSKSELFRITAYWPGRSNMITGEHHSMSEQIQRTREVVLGIFAELGSEDTELCETVLIRDGQYCGHRFSCDEFSAVWFFEENEIKVSDNSRSLLRVESLDQPTIRRAA